MIILVTGTPGAGKTLYATTELWKEFADRPKYVSGITDLQLTAEPFEAKEWQSLPPGAVLFVDECQFTFPKRAAGAKVPEFVELLTTHRHKGIDIVLITQHPKLIDEFVRRLVGRHVHLERALGLQRATTCSWDACYDDFLTAARKNASVRGTFRYPVEAFANYKSAEVHTVKRRIPKSFIFIPILLVFGIVAGYYGMLQATGQGIGKTVPTPTALAGASAQLSRDFEPRSPNPLADAIAKNSGIIGQPWTRPEFAKLIEPKRAPFPAACGTKRVSDTVEICRCWTDDATVIEPIDPKFCRDFVTGMVYASHRVTVERDKADTVLREGGKLSGPTASPAALLRGVDTGPQPQVPPMEIGASRTTQHRSAQWTQ